MTAPTPAKADETTDLRDSPAYGIIDPDYARVFTIARCIAWTEGYALLLSGSFTRDLDLLAVPWVEQATDAEHLVRRIALALDDLDILVKDRAAPSQASEKPHGRRAWTLTFKAFGDPRFVDLSVMPREAAHAAEIQALCGRIDRALHHEEADETPPSPDKLYEYALEARDRGDDAEARADRLAAENAKMAAALKPFAHLASAPDVLTNHGVLLQYAPDDCLACGLNISVADLRAARAALPEAIPPKETSDVE